MQRTLLRNLLSLLRRYPKRFALAFLMLLISNLLLLSNPLVFREAIKTYSGETTAFFGPHIAPWALTLFIISVVSAYFKYSMRIAFVGISRDVEKDVRERLFERIQDHSRAFFDRHGIGELLSRLTNDISIYRDLLGPGIMYPLFFLTIVIPGVAALFYISVPLATISLIPLALIPALNWLVRHNSYRLSLGVQKALGQMSSVVQEHYSGIRIVKSYGIEQLALNKFKNLCRDFAKLSFKMSSLQNTMFPLFTFCTRTTTVLLVLVSGYIILRAWGELSAGDFLAFVWLQSYIFGPVLMLGWVLPIYERGRAAYERLIEIYDEPLDIKDNASSALKIAPQADIYLKNLSFAYPGSEVFSLKNINLEINGGTFVGITGPVGSGKSTLLHLLNREYEVPPNMIFIGEHEIHEYPLQAFKVEVIAVEQAAFLFSRSVADNVRFGKIEASQAELELVSQYADLHDTVMEFSDQYATIVGERGMTLSGGQKQRVAVARAFLVDRSILLLDDIFSAVDARTEKRIFGAIKTNYSDRTILLVTHRVSVLEQLDLVVYMIDGEIAEVGTPEQLRELKGHYAALAELQRHFQAES